MLWSLYQVRAAISVHINRAEHLATLPTTGVNTVSRDISTSDTAGRPATVALADDRESRATFGGCGRWRHFGQASAVSLGLSEVPAVGRLVKGEFLGTWEDILWLCVNYHHLSDEIVHGKNPDLQIGEPKLRDGFPGSHFTSSMTAAWGREQITPKSYWMRHKLAFRIRHPLQRGWIRIWGLLQEKVKSWWLASGFAGVWMCCKQLKRIEGTGVKRGDFQAPGPWKCPKCTAVRTRLYSLQSGKVSSGLRKEMDFSVQSTRMEAWQVLSKALEIDVWLWPGGEGWSLEPDRMLLTIQRRTWIDLGQSVAPGKEHQYYLGTCLNENSWVPPQKHLIRNPEGGAQQPVFLVNHSGDFDAG